MSTTKISAAPVSGSWIGAVNPAAGWCPATLLIGVTGVLIAQGHDGLSLILGFAGAVFLWAGVLAPAMAAVNAPNVPAYLATRTDSTAVATVAAAVLAIALAGLLAGEISAAVSALAPIFVSAPMAFAVAIGAATIGTIWGPRTQNHLLAGTILAGLAILVVLAALAALSFRDGPGALVSIPALSDIAAFEQGLLEKRLADPASFKPHAVPFLRTDALNFTSLIVSLSLGLALLATPLPTGKAQAQQPAKRAARAALLATTLLVLLAPLAASAKRALLAWFSAGVRPGAMPDWTAPYRDIGALQICGSSSADAAMLAKACGKGVGTQGFVRWHEAVFSSDSLLFVSLDATAGPAAPALKILIAVAVAAAAIWTAGRIANLVRSTQGPASAKTFAIPLIVLTVASGLALLKTADTVTLLTWSASLAAAALAPAVFASALSARAPHRAAVIAAITTGAAATLLAVLGARYAPLELFTATSQMSAAPASVAKKLATLQDTWASAAEGPGRDALRLQAEKLARDNLNWFGIKPQSGAILGAALGVAILLAGAFLARIAALRTSR